MSDKKGSKKLPIGQDVPKEKTRQQSFPISFINTILYQELSARFGIGEEERDEDRNRIILVRCLNPDDPLTGFPGKIRYMYNKVTGHSYFGLYAWIDQEDPELELAGGPRRCGLYAYDGREDLMIESLNASFQFKHGLNLQSPATIFIGRIIEAAGELAKDPNCSRDQFWSAERFK